MQNHLFRSCFVFISLIGCVQAAATSPQWATTTEAVDRAPNLKYSSRILSASGESGRLDSTPYVTVFLPTDSACPDSIKSAIDPTWAKRFILNHSFAGQINIRKLDGKTGLIVNRVQTDGSVVSIGGSESMVIRNILDEPVRFSIANGRVLLGGHATVTGNLIVVTRTGSLGLIDDCRAL